jgi:PilZ domain
MLHTAIGAVPVSPSVFERREFGRRECALPGVVMIPLRQALPCMMLNVSRGGALLQVDKFEFVPQRFKLQVGNFESICHVRHRDGRLIGVEFDVPCRYDPVEHEDA